MRETSQQNLTPWNLGGISNSLTEHPFTSRSKRKTMNTAMKRSAGRKSLAITLLRVMVTMDCDGFALR